jgi:proteic killer suppression protein
VIRSYKNEGSQDIAEGLNTKSARQTLPTELWKIAVRRLAFIDSVQSLVDLRTSPRGYGWEILKKDRAGQHSIRINDQYRICFRFEEGDCSDVEIVDYHS